mmetsp:Transcript_20643/g.30543  ORF Transcript_20643/g.30543 Transcript_20643/m.30543 type:complete len:161 (+) Transcript_20643:2-484(+)
MSEPESYNEGILGKSPEDYCDWIKKEENWGGEIELHILSIYFGIEIFVVDILTNNLYKYGHEKNFMERIFLLYDGIHYDSLVEAFNRTANESNDTTKFSVNDNGIVNDFKKLAADLNKKGKYLDLGGCELQCLVCGRGMKGQKEAREHALVSKHQNFGQI